MYTYPSLSLLCLISANLIRQWENPQLLPFVMPFQLSRWWTFGPVPLSFVQYGPVGIPEHTALYCPLQHQGR